ncbi:MAG TPA: hypothetical protein EYN66_09455 [Myxococcales bacterium]|nr:hypothetical protein [Myxococcales bacterium]
MSPKAKADTVTIHRIEFNEKERRLLEQAMAAFTFNKVASPVVAGMSNVTFLIAFTLLVEGLLGISILSLTTDTIEGIIADWRAYRESEAYRAGYYAEAGSVVGGFGNLIDNLFDFITGGPFARAEARMNQEAEMEAENEGVPIDPALRPSESVR